MTTETHRPAGAEPGIEERPAGRVLVTGGAGSLGRRVVAALAASTQVSEVISVDLADLDGRVDGVRSAAADLATADLSPLLERIDAVVHLAFAKAESDDDEPAAAAADVLGASRLLEAAGAAGVGHAVILSSATVYGAWPANPVPLTEEAPVRPNPGSGYAVTRAEVERLGVEWAGAHDGATLAVLRPAPTVGDDYESWLSSALRQASGIRPGDADPPVQFVHLDDVAAAVVLACEGRLDGVYNVAPDGWITAEQVRALRGSPPRVPVPERLSGALAAVAWRWRVARTPPGLLPYVVHPWVVANDRLEAEGWRATRSNEEAFVAAHDATPWSRLSPGRRQELALAGSATLLTGLAAGAVALVLRHRRRP